MNAGIASAARMPMIATTIISSMRVKPARRFEMILRMSSFQLPWAASGADLGAPFSNVRAASLPARFERRAPDALGDEHGARLGVGLERYLSSVLVEIALRLRHVP